jgi:hypothetical protein
MRLTAPPYDEVGMAGLGFRLPMLTVIYLAW